MDGSRAARLRPLAALAAALLLSGCLGGGGLTFLGAGDRGGADAGIEVSTLDDPVQPGADPVAGDEAGDPDPLAPADPARSGTDAEAPPPAPAEAPPADTQPPSDTLAEDAPPATAPPSPLAAACTERGGRPVLFGGGPAIVCAMPARDAGQRCSTGRDCQGLCLARSRTCAPVVPLLGCHDVLTDNGTPARQCIE
jgi:hypothetical protein